MKGNRLQCLTNFVLSTIFFHLLRDDDITKCQGFSMISNKTSSPILTHSEANSSIQFDTACVANPVILPPDEYIPEWQCYYYGNNGTWNGGKKSFLPTGSTGLATSQDGIHWTKVIGKERDGAVLVPSDSGWDSVHIGGNDVIRVGDELHMYYFGADDEEVSMGGPTSMMNVIGMRMRIGRARSKDNGKTWIKDKGYLLDYDESEGLFASWPRIVKTINTDGLWLMTYHSYDGQKWRVFGAESVDEGDTWSRIGLILQGGDSENAFDNQGIGTRSVIPWRDGLLMIYEGVSMKNGRHRLGAAYMDYSSSDNNKEWIKLNDGLPILEPGKSPLGEWASFVIGTPFVVSMPDGSLRLYHCGKKGVEDKMSIGVVESKTGDITPDAWTPLP